MATSFCPVYHIPGLTGLSIKRTLGLILALSGKNPIIQDEDINFQVEFYKLFAKVLVFEKFLPRVPAAIPKFE